MQTDYYAEYNRLIGLWWDRMKACTHGGPYRHTFRRETVDVCTDCEHEACQLSAGANEAYRVARKRQLADMPRCQIDGCRARGMWWLGGHVLLACGRHAKQIEAEHNRRMAGSGILGLLCPPDWTADDLRKMAKGR